MSRILVVSPHLDDAVLSSSDLIAHHPGTIVVTVLAGQPAADLPLTDWDRASGFTSSLAAITERRREDTLALSVLMARARFLDHPDRQYGVASLEAITDDVTQAINDCRPEIIAFPLGLHHPDHLMVSRLMLQLRDAASEKPIEWIVWADSPYRALPGLLEARLTDLRSDRDVFPRITFLPKCAQKTRALVHYASQIKALANDRELDINDVWSAEQYWSVGPAKAQHVSELAQNALSFSTSE